MDFRPYGDTGLRVSTLGLGAGQLGDARLPEDDAQALLHAAIDAGVTLVDTAPGYGLSEERIGRHLGARRERVVLSTKLGYGVEGVPDWTGPCITAGVDQALRRLRTDRIDIAHLHSCPRAILEHGEVVDALDEAKRSGKVRAIAYSGDNEALDYARDTGRFDGLMASLNVCDQGAAARVLPRLGGMGFIAKRPTANHPWRFDTVPVGDYCEPYWHRWQAMQPHPRGLPWGELALRFTLSLPGVASAIVGTTRVAHLQQNLAWAAKGPLPQDHVDALRATWQAHDAGWRGEV
jgi:aryl-alcohol dehydrogenase-like predicted oxidoreductase